MDLFFIAEVLPNNSFETSLSAASLLIGWSWVRFTSSAKRPLSFPRYILIAWSVVGFVHDCRGLPMDWPSERPWQMPPQLNGERLLIPRLRCGGQCYPRSTSTRATSKSGEGYRVKQKPRCGKARRLIA